MSLVNPESLPKPLADAVRRVLARGGVRSENNHRVLPWAIAMRSAKLPAGMHPPRAEGADPTDVPHFIETQRVRQVEAARVDRKLEKKWRKNLARRKKQAQFETSIQTSDRVIAQLTKDWTPADEDTSHGIRVGRSTIHQDKPKSSGSDFH